MEEERENEFEKIVLTNIWLKINILDPIAEISQYLFQAENGVLISGESSIEQETLDFLKFDGFRLLRTKLGILLDNSETYINSSIYKLVKELLEIVSEKNDNIIKSTICIQAEYPMKYKTTLNHIYNKVYLLCIKEAKTKLIGEIANQEMLMPKKNKQEGEKIE